MCVIKRDESLRKNIDVSLTVISTKDSTKLELTSLSTREGGGTVTKLVNQIRDETHSKYKFLLIYTHTNTPPELKLR